MVQLAAGDMIPGDVRVVHAKDPFVIQGALTGERFPVEKYDVDRHPTTTAPLELTSVAFLGTSEESGSATAVVEGRRVFANTLKYVRMGASSGFGNMFSVLGASVLLPFLPMTPVQILANNLLYDLGQTAVPSDAVDAEQLERPRP